MVYFLLLPKSDAFQSSSSPTYSAVPTNEDHENGAGDLVDESETRSDSGLDGIDSKLSKPRLPMKQKMDLAKPLFFPFILPLFIVYFAEVCHGNFLND